MPFTFCLSGIALRQVADVTLLKFALKDSLLVTVYDLNSSVSPWNKVTVIIENFSGQVPLQNFPTEVNTASGNDLMPLGSNTLLEPTMNKI